jgi:D-glycero-D-manno-heptose 1,7-bisphosphate phosphatase
MIRLLIFLIGIALFVLIIYRILQIRNGRKTKLVLLDRDGVINKDRKDFVKSISEFIFIDGSIEAIKKLNDAAIKVAIVTNQSAVGRELITRQDLQDIHDYMNGEIEKHNAKIDAIYFCVDHPDSATNRRKPGTGMLEEAVNHFKVKVEETHMIGDALRDLQPAKKLGIHRHLVLTGKGETTIKDTQLQECSPFEVHKNLLDAVNSILKDNKN